ncbi:Leucine-rich repeat [Trinorchestia longiramus]|nr:Leucine-rich repeat [Trinorchestia longiramus]
MKLAVLSALALGLVMIQRCCCRETWPCPRSCNCQLNAYTPQPEDAVEQDGQTASQLSVSCNKRRGASPGSPPPLGSQPHHLVRLDVTGADAAELLELVQSLPYLQHMYISSALDPHTTWHSLFRSCHCNSLTTVVIRHSRVKNLRSDTFVKLHALTHLDLRYNELVSTYSGDSNMENPSTAVTDNWRSDHTQYSNVSEIQGLTPSEGQTDVGTGQPEEAAQFLLQLPHAVQRLLLSHNNITRLALLNSSVLTTLDLSYNSIARLEPNQIALPQLKKLSIGGPQLELQPGLLSPATLPRVQDLELLGTAEHHLTLGRGVERDLRALLALQLTALTLHRCRLSSLALVTSVATSRLQHLSITSSTILTTRLMPPTFNMSSVTSLSFRGTPFLAKNFLNPPGRQKYRQTPLPQLMTLVVADAEVKTLPANILTRLPQLKELDISSNPLHCTCEDFAWLVGLVALNRLTLINADNTTCAYPQHLKSKLLLQENLCASTPADTAAVYQELLQENTSSSVMRNFTNLGTNIPALIDKPNRNLQQVSQEQKVPASLESKHKNLDGQITSHSVSAQNIFVALLVVVAFVGILTRGRQQCMQKKAQ